MNNPTDLQSPVMPRPRTRPTEADRASLRSIRQDAAVARSEALSGAPDASDDLLGHLAWVYVVAGDESGDVTTLVRRALKERYSWAQIAGACGIDPEPGETDEAYMTRVQVFMQRMNRRTLG